MSYWEAAPDPLLLPFVERVSFSTDEGELPMPEGRRVVPDGCVDLLFEVADVEASAGERPCRAELLGTKTRALMLTGTGSSQNVALTLLPGTASRFFRRPLSELTDRAVDLHQVWGRRGEVLCRAVGAEDSAPRRAALIQRELLASLGAEDAADTEVGEAVRALVRSRGKLSVRELCAHVGVSERRVERLFRQRVGVRPKLLAGLLRFRAAYSALRVGSAQADVASRCGYADQSHLHRDFRRFAGTSPLRLLAGPGPLSESSKTRA